MCGHRCCAFLGRSWLANVTGGVRVDSSAPRGVTQAHVALLAFGTLIPWILFLVSDGVPLQTGVRRDVVVVVFAGNYCGSPSPACVVVRSLCRRVCSRVCAQLYDTEIMSTLAYTISAAVFSVLVGVLLAVAKHRNWRLHQHFDGLRAAEPDTNEAVEDDEKPSASDAAVRSDANGDIDDAPLVSAPRDGDRDALDEPPLQRSVTARTDIDIDQTDADDEEETNPDADW